MTTPTSADPGVSVTLYKAVTATVTWEQVRAAAKSMGMRPTKLEGAEDIEAWVHDSGRRVYIGGDADDMGHEIETLARLAGTSPGEMLQRIVGPAKDPRTPYDGAPPEGMSECPCGRAFCAGNGVAISVGAKWQSEPISQRAVSLAQCLSSAYTWSSTSYAQHGDAEVLRVGPGWMGVALETLRLECATRNRWREEQKALAEYSDVATEKQQAAEDMRERCADHAAGMVDGWEASDIAAAIRALPLTAEPAGAWVSDETGHPSTADVIRDAAKAWAALHGGRVASVIVETPSVEEPDAGPYDDRCRWFLGNRGARCRYVFDHHRRGVPCAARTSAAPPVADASAELRARLVAELHAAGRPKLADRMSVDVRWRSLVDFVNPEILDMLSESLRKDIKTEVPK